MGVEAHLRIGSVLSVARGLFVPDVGDESFDEGDRAGTGVDGAGTGGSSGICGGLLVSDPEVRRL